GEDVPPSSPSVIKTRTRRWLSSRSPAGEPDQERNGLRNTLQKETPGSTTDRVALPKFSKMAPRLCAFPQRLELLTFTKFLYMASMSPNSSMRRTACLPVKLAPSVKAM